ncbi:diguanylate cyclase [Vibrio sp. Of7-15]|uniref:diguanylate cyclase n=1 Tax=Vibrio sp. Of7-15 TaxID=2724879 RepID=UPI001EF3796C|nr:diguanylate cyclase [Vibrio sp. Of7-15]MCG7497019.1 diguanylate cyclase [Vibrio sp. Of7-15]
MNQQWSRFIFLLSFFGIACSSISTWLLYSAETEVIYEEFTKAVNDKAVALERELMVNVEVLYAIKGLYNSSEEVTYSEYSRFAQSLLERHNDIQALEWVPKVSILQRDDMERIHQQFFQDFEFKEKNEQGQLITAKRRTVYFPVHYVEPYIGNEKVLGYDLGSEQVRLSTLIESRDFGVMLASERVTLVQDNQEQNGFLLFLPVYDGVSSTLTSRRKNLLGFVVGVFRIADIFSIALTGSDSSQMYLRLLDDNAPENKKLLYNNSELLAGEMALTQHAYTKRIGNIGGRIWSLTAMPTQNYMSSRRTAAPWLAFVFSLTLFGAIVSILYMVIKRSQIILDKLRSQSMALKEAKEKLELASRTDSLTGVANRKYFEQYLKNEWERACTNKQSITVVLVDVDHFKAYNDRYGHVMGDSCLKFISSALKRTLRRPADVIARYSGEEFALVFPETDNASLLGERCRQAVDLQDFPHASSLVKNNITVSVGVISVQAKESIKVNDVIKLADKALFKAKALGRNRVVVATYNKAHLSVEDVEPDSLNGQ